MYTQQHHPFFHPIQNQYICEYTIIELVYFCFILFLSFFSLFLFYCRLFYSLARNCWILYLKLYIQVMLRLIMIAWFESVCIKNRFNASFDQIRQSYVCIQFSFFDFVHFYSIDWHTLDVVKIPFKMNSSLDVVVWFEYHFYRCNEA